MAHLLTKGRLELLRLFITNPDKSFYMHEIGRSLSKNPGVFQRTINAMVEEGILESEYRANARYFRINRDNPLYPELKGMVEKTTGISESIKGMLNRVGGVDKAFIYGSYARGKHNAQSDIDLLVIGDVDEDALLREVEKLEKAFHRDINYKFYTTAELKKSRQNKNAFLCGILYEKIIPLKGNENEIREILKGKSR